MKYLIFSLFFLVACGEIEECDIVGDCPEETITEARPSDTVAPTNAPTSKPIITDAPVATNPIPLKSENFRDGSGGNLWKPVSDTNGNLVVIFSSKFKKEFSGGCTVTKKDGTKEKLYCGGAFKCFGNPDAGGERLHMRSNIKCDKAKEVKVVCLEAKQEVTFTVDKKYLNQVCSRHD